uniref:Uncharacterized protein n=1 Tax=Spironucleus salmonicida TaxID=348837 RepID=V6LLV7_9EUKA|eukprot:EST41684.1 Hypothetical protein SS50377_18771 [Spironucleus salmonicida]
MVARADEAIRIVFLGIAKRYRPDIVQQCNFSNQSFLFSMLSTGALNIPTWLMAHLGQLKDWLVSTHFLISDCDGFDIMPTARSLYSWNRLCRPMMMGPNPTAGDHCSGWKTIKILYN